MRKRFLWISSEKCVNGIMWNFLYSFQSCNYEGNENIKKLFGGDLLITLKVINECAVKLRNLKQHLFRDYKLLYARCSYNVRGECGEENNVSCKRRSVRSLARLTTPPIKHSSIGVETKT